MVVSSRQTACWNSLPRGQRQVELRALAGEVLGELGPGGREGLIVPRAERADSRVTGVVREVEPRERPAVADQGERPDRGVDDGMHGSIVLVHTR
jgi:hypothetical protein